jgi:hypothetical protein
MVGNWKIADLSLSENALVTKIVMTNVVNTDVTPSAFYLSNFELYHDGVKVATASTMNSTDNTVTFGDGETTMFTVTDGDTNGKTLVVKCDIDDDITKDNEIDLQITGTDVTAKGASTGIPIDAAGTDVKLDNGILSNKKVQQSYATITNVDISATSASQGQSTEVLRFTVTPKAGKTLNLTNMSFTLTDDLGSTTNEAITVFDVTNSVGVPVVEDPSDADTGYVANTITDFNDGGNAIVTFNGAIGTTVTNLQALSNPVTFSVRVDTRGSGGKSYQVGIKFTGNTLKVDAPTQATTPQGFAPVGDKITGKTVTISNT